MTRERLDGWCEKAILALVLAILVFGPLAMGAVRGQDFAVIEWLTGGVGLLWLARLWLNPNQPILWTPASWAVLFFVVFAGIRYFTADVEYVAREEVLKILTCALLFFAVTSNLSRQRSEKVLVVTLLVLATGLALYAIYQFVTQSQHVWQYLRPGVYGRRGSGTYFNPNHLAGLLEMIAPLGLALAVAGRFSVPGRIMLAYASVMALAGIGVTLSRGGWIATGMAMVAFLALLIWQRIRRAEAMVLLGVLVVAGGVFVLENRITQKRFAAMFQDGRVTDVRFKLWEPTVAMWRDNPWFGVGPGHFDVRFREYRPVEVQLRPEFSHNDYLNTLADWGVVGMAFVALPWLMVFVGLVRGWNVIAQAKDGVGEARSNRLALAIGAGIGLLAILLHSVIDFNLRIPANAIVAVTLLALLTGLMRHVSGHYLRWPARGARVGVSLVLLLASVLLIWQGARRWTEEQVLAKAVLQEDLPGEQTLLLEAAFNLEPKNPATAYRLGEAYRLQSWAGGTNYVALAERALRWHERAAELQPYDPYSRMSAGMCLDWTGKHEEAEPWFRRAIGLDPNNHYVLAHVGWHYAQAGDYAAAVPWLEKSLRINSWNNPVAASYLDIARRRLTPQSVP